MITTHGKKAQSDEIDRILDKLKKSGYESLTTEEKKSLLTRVNVKPMENGKRKMKNENITATLIFSFHLSIFNYYNEASR